MSDASYTRLIIGNLIELNMREAEKTSSKTIHDNTIKANFLNEMFNWAEEKKLYEEISKEKIKF